MYDVKLPCVVSSINHLPEKAKLEVNLKSVFKSTDTIAFFDEVDELFNKYFAKLNSGS